MFGLVNFRPIFKMETFSHNVDVGYYGIYLWIGKYVIGLGETDDLVNCGYPEPNYPFGIYIKFSNFKWSNWDLEESDLP